MSLKQANKHMDALISMLMVIARKFVSSFLPLFSSTCLTLCWGLSRPAGVPVHRSCSPTPLWNALAKDAAVHGSYWTFVSQNLQPGIAGLELLFPGCLFVCLLVCLFVCAAVLVAGPWPKKSRYGQFHGGRLST